MSSHGVCLLLLYIKILANRFSDDETDMKALTDAVLSITMDGLVWGGHKLVPVGFGIKKLQLNVVVEDDKVSLEDLQTQIEGFEDFVQSTDIAAMQKL
jgi:elongation factor 1-beta